MSTIIVCIGSACLILLSICAALLYKLTQKQHCNASDPEDIRHAVQSGIDTAFRRHENEFAALCAEEFRLAEWLKAQLEQDDINLASLAKETSERTIALAIKMAEDEVMLATNALKKVLNATTNTQGRLAISTENDYPDPVIKRWLTALKSLQAQEVEARERLAKAEANLEKVTQLAEIANPISESTSDPSSDCGEEQW